MTTEYPDLEKQQHIELCKKWAKRYYELGYKPIPIKYKSKTPNIESTTSYFRENVPEETFNKWIQEERYENIGILGGELSCFDFDDPASFKQNELSPQGLIDKGAWVTETPKEPGRYHVVGTDRAKGITTRKSAEGIELRQWEHYWLVYPSIHPNGKRYNLLNTKNPEELTKPGEINALAVYETYISKLRTIRGTVQKNKEILQNKNSFDNGPDCIRPAWEQGATSGARYYTAGALGSWLQQQKFPLDMALSLIRTWFTEKCSQEGRPLSDIENAAKLGYEGKYQTGCTWWREKTDFCPYPNQKDCSFCKSIGKDKKEIPKYIMDVDGELLESDNSKADIIEENGYIDDDSLIGQYTKYQNQRTNASMTYGTHLCIAMLGHVMGRKVVNRIQPKAVRHNIYLALLGPSGKARKSTAQELARDVYIQTTAMPDGFSPEGYLKALSETSQGMGWLGELSTLLRGINNGGPMANFKEVANDLFGCPEVYQKRLARNKDSFIVSEPYLSLITTCTEEGVFPCLNPDLVHGGFLARWMFVYGRSAYRKREKLTKDIEEKEHQFRQAFLHLYNQFKETEVYFELTEDGEDALDEICRELEDNSYWNGVEPFVARYENYIIAYADIIRLSDILGKIQLSSLSSLSLLSSLSQLAHTNNNAMLGVCDNFVKRDNRDNCDKREIPVITINSDYIRRAWDILRPRLEYTRRFVRYVDEDFKVGKVESILEKFAPIPHSRAMQYSHLNKKDFNDAIDTLLDRETAFYFHIQHNARGRKRKKMIYCTAANIDSKKCKRCQFKCTPDQRTPDIFGLSAPKQVSPHVEIKATPSSDDKGIYFEDDETKDKQSNLSQLEGMQQLREFFSQGLVSEDGLLAFLKNVLNKKDPQDSLSFFIERGILYRNGRKYGFSGGV